MVRGGQRPRDVGKELSEKLRELGQKNPFEVLDLLPTATKSAVRVAFLRLTKEWHPSLFARQEPAVRALSTEVFLLIRRAHDDLHDDTKRQAWRDRVQPQGTQAFRPGVVQSPIASTTTPVPRYPATTAPPRAAPGSFPGLAEIDQALIAGQLAEARTRMAAMSRAPVQAPLSEFQARQHTWTALDLLQKGQPAKARRLLEDALAAVPGYPVAAGALAALPGPDGGPARIVSKLFGR